MGYRYYPTGRGRGIRNPPVAIPSRSFVKMLLNPRPPTIGLAGMSKPNILGQQAVLNHNDNNTNGNAYGLGGIHGLKAGADGLGSGPI